MTFENVDPTQSGLSWDDDTEFSLAIEMARTDHLIWRRELISSVRNELDVDAVDAGFDDRCNLGKWLESVSFDRRDLEHYQTICALHRAFHLEASSLISMLDTPNLAASQWSRMDEASDELVRALEAWQRAVAPHAVHAGFSSVHLLR
jgi:hypothetical protein